MPDTDPGEAYEPHVNTENLTDGDYMPYPEKSLTVDAERQRIVQCICNLYSGSASEEDMQVYAKVSVYDDPLSYCDTRYKIAGQWYGVY